MAREDKSRRHLTHAETQRRIKEIADHSIEVKRTEDKLTKNKITSKNGQTNRRRPECIEQANTRHGHVAIQAQKEHSVPR